MCVFVVMVQPAVQTSLHATIASVCRSSLFATDGITVGISLMNKSAVSYIFVHFTRFVHDLLSSPTAVTGVRLLPPFVCVSVCFSARYLKDRCS